MSLEVVLAGPTDYFFDPAAAAIKAGGHSVVRYRSVADFAATPDALASASVLYAVGFCPVTRAQMERAPHLRAVISTWTGTEGFDERAATGLGIVVGNGQIPENTESMAEATILMILACIYDLNGAQQRFRDKNWNQADLTGRMLKGKTIGILGYGGIARAITHRLAPWGVNFCATTRHPPADPSVVRFLPLEEMLAASDVVCVLAPRTEETLGLLSAQRLALMKPGAILICTSRGGIIDEDALLSLAAKGHFGAVGLDVFAQEPLPSESPLYGLKNAVMTPHRVGLTQEARAKLIETGIANVLRVLDGRPPLYVRNPEILDRWRAKWGGA
ncbi:MAG: NAD(P)-dependent oxidoreductase [Rhodospirillaceae bacterium]